MARFAFKQFVALEEENLVKMLLQAGVQERNGGGLNYGGGTADGKKWMDLRHIDKSYLRP